ncbi:hypothetical protein Aoc01nite_88780 [Actinoplanes octamycinicus]|nr:hypothetical protein Aoc01nite_88780 [Actinoplanes octamycinicus]
MRDLQQGRPAAAGQEQTLARHPADHRVGGKETVLHVRTVIRTGAGFHEWRRPRPVAVGPGGTPLAMQRIA